MKPLTTKNTYLDNFLLGILAGIAIGIGGFLNLLMNSFGLKYLGGILFSVGLFSVCFFGFHLYTGRVGYSLENKPSYILSLLIMLVGNAIGAIGFGLLMGLVFKGVGGDLLNTAQNVANSKTLPFDENSFKQILKILVFSFFCGIMVYLAVDIFKKSKSFIIKTLGLITCVALFVITGMEHCIANMFYFAATYSLNINAILAILIAIVGNTLGALGSYVVNKTIKRD